MKRSVVITFYSNQYPEAARVVYEKFHAYTAKGFEHHVKNDPLFLPLEENSPKIEEVIQFIRQNYHCDPCDVRGYYLYTKKDKDNAQFLHLKTHYPLELEGKTLASYGTKYGFVCPVCGVKEDIIGNALVDRAFIRNKPLGAFEPELYVSEAVRKLFEENNITGITFGPELVDYKNRDMPKHYIMQINSILPEVSASTWIEHY